MTCRAMQDSRLSAWPRMWVAAATLPVLVLGWIEGWYGRTAAGDVYGSDAVQYLDIARAMERGDWHSALNPLWSQGYPALVALVRPLFARGASGEWDAIRLLNFGIFVLSWICFVALLRELLRGRERSVMTVCGAVFVFVTTQVCMDQVSRVGPDQLVAAIFFLVCVLLLRLRRGGGWGLSVALGILLGTGFLVKAVFLPLGCAAVVIAVVALRRRVWVSAPAILFFAAIVLGYGAQLSRAVGWRTLGEAGALNYAWHVDRLAKWVHWEGGVEPAAKAWPKPAIARFAQWESDPPDFGKPLHPSVIECSAPAMYVFHAPVAATYVPYFDPPYWYRGYHRVVRWRYQVIALAKNVGDLVVVLLAQPFFWVVLLAGVIVLWRREDRARLWAGLPGWWRESWPVVALAVFGVAVYLPVHLEGRYLSPFLAVLLVAKLERLGAAVSVERRLILLVLPAVGFAVGLVKDQRVEWMRAVHGWDYRAIPEWREGAALAAELQGDGLPDGSEIGVISWTANVQCDWAYLAGVRITSETATPADEKAFWALDEAGRAAVLARFRQAGATAVVTREIPEGGQPGWRQVGGLPMWVHRL